MNTPGEVKAAIVARMKSQRLSQTALSRRSGVHQSQVSKICAGRFKRSGANLRKICHALGLGEPVVTNEAELVKLLRSIVRKHPTKIAALGKTLSAIRELSG